MTTSRHYTLLVPRLDRTGPCNVAVDVGHAAVSAGWTVRLLFLSGVLGRDDVQGFAEVRRFRLSDLLHLDGVVHTHCLRPDLIGALLSFNRRCEVLTTLHNYFLIDLGFDHPRWRVRCAWFVWRWAIARHRHRVCISNAMRRYYRRLLPGQSFDRVYNFRPARDGSLDAADSRTVHWIAAQRDASRTCLVYVGSLSRRKNLLPLIQALSSEPTLALMLCGDGPLLAELGQAVVSQGLADRVLLLGQIAQPQSVVALADVLVLPSFAEGLPLVVIEAASQGLPCLLSNIAVHRELAALGLGCTFDHHRFQDFGAAVQRVASLATPAGREKRIAVWQTHFSPALGFAQYQQLLEGRAT